MFFNIIVSEILKVTKILDFMKHFLKKHYLTILLKTVKCGSMHALRCEFWFNNGISTFLSLDTFNKDSFYIQLSL